MTQTARNFTMADEGFLVDHRCLIHVRKGKYCPAFDDTIKDGGVMPVVSCTPPTGHPGHRDTLTRVRR